MISLALMYDERNIERFWERVDQQEGSTDPNPCWLWTGPLTPQGYGVFSVRVARPGRKVRFSKRSAHRYSYRLANPAMRRDREIDHVCHSVSLNCPGGVLCWHRRCVNPEHLEQVTAEVNNDRRINRVVRRNRRDAHAESDMRDLDTTTRYRAEDWSPWHQEAS